MFDNLFFLMGPTFGALLLAGVLFVVMLPVLGLSKPSARARTLRLSTIGR